MALFLRDKTARGPFGSLPATTARSISGASVSGDASGEDPAAGFPGEAVESARSNGVRPSIICAPALSVVSAPCPLHATVVSDNKANGAARRRNPHGLRILDTRSEVRKGGDRSGWMEAESESDAVAQDPGGLGGSVGWGVSQGGKDPETQVVVGTTILFQIISVCST